MKRFAIGLAFTLGLVPFAGDAAAQVCPYTLVWNNYGQGCAIVAPKPPTISAEFDGQNACVISVQIGVPPVCCNVFTQSVLMVVGLQPLNVPAPGGCTLLASPDILIPLAPGTGSIGVKTTLPSSPSLAGLSLYAQGIVGRFTTIGFTLDYEFSNGVALAFQ